MRRTKPFTPNSTKPNLSKFLLPALLFGGTVLLILAASQFNGGALSEAIDNLAFGLGDRYQQWFDKQSTNNPLVLLSLSFAGGLIASISPCILCLLPVNLSYIGTREITSRWDALIKAGSFVLGVVTMLSLFGLFSSLAGAVLIHFRGYVQVVVGAVIIVMGLMLLGIVHLPLPQTNFKLPIAGPFGVGLTFALVSSPCTSPVMFAVLAAAAATGSQIQSVLSMVSYSLGYTAIIFFASLFTGLVKRTRFLLNHSQGIVRFGSVALILIGGYYLVDGVSWFVLPIMSNS
ncbi:cytochrome c biogenesis CcdA family protein [Allocoleopsis franciscana]|uniref:Cytochrome c biogenesis protein n=1 Tax=Allocoleopsis franciscana PCC 7113 TaxID=1173027 RepID=K9WGE8_9CYAN|nr:cytochrome c biogenesis CcdA family protein [Allocoleopsis franciscana]AFZ19268.1 cytochrome c biogenesis protein [Allocoleopsis franciscana PCC 7113]